MAQLSNAAVADRCLRPAREAALARLLAELEARIAPRPLAGLTAPDLRAFVNAKQAAGYHASTLRRQLKMLRAHYRRLAVADDSMWATYSAIRSTELPPDTSHSGPHPYSADQIDGLWALLDERWPKLPPDRDWHWLTRWRAGRLSGSS